MPGNAGMVIIRIELPSYCVAVRAYVMIGKECVRMGTGIIVSGKSKVNGSLMRRLAVTEHLRYQWNERRDLPT